MVRVRSQKVACLSPYIRSILMDLKYLLTNQLFSVRSRSDAPRNIDACIVDGMFLVHSHVDLPSTFGGLWLVLSDVQIM